MQITLSGAHQLILTRQFAGSAGDCENVSDYWLPTNRAEDRWAQRACARTDRALCARTSGYFLAWCYRCSRELKGKGTQLAHQRNIGHHDSRSTVVALALFSSYHEIWTWIEMWNEKYKIVWLHHLLHEVKPSSINCVIAIYILAVRSVYYVTLQRHYENNFFSVKPHSGGW